MEKAADQIKNPLVLEFLGLAEQPHYSEDDLETAIIDQLESFLLELGKGFLFEARQNRFTFDNEHFRVDLVFNISMRQAGGRGEDAVGEKRISLQETGGSFVPSMKPGPSGTRKEIP